MLIKYDETTDYLYQLAEERTKKKYEMKTQKVEEEKEKVEQEKQIILETGVFNLLKLNVAEKEIISMFSLTKKQLNAIKEKYKKEL